MAYVLRLFQGAAIVRMITIGNPSQISRPPRYPKIPKARGESVPKGMKVFPREPPSTAPVIVSPPALPVHSSSSKHVGKLLGQDTPSQNSLTASDLTNPALPQLLILRGCRSALSGDFFRAGYLHQTISPIQSSGHSSREEARVSKDLRD